MLKKNTLFFLAIFLFNAIVFGEKTIDLDKSIPQKSTNNNKRRVVADFDGDGKTDLSVYRPTDGDWHIWRSSDNSYQVTHFGEGDRDVIAPGDFDGDGKTDFAVRRDCVWYILNSSTSTIRYECFGTGYERQIVGDYDGDGKDDVAVYREGVWYIIKSFDKSIYYIQFGLANDFPVPADYDGDGKTDIAVHRPSDEPDEPDFYILNSSDFSVNMYLWGIRYFDRAMIGDYDGDGRADVTVYRSSDGEYFIGNWYILKSTGGYSVEHFGEPSCSRLVRGDYDGDGKDDIAYYDCDGNWHIKESSTNNIRIQNFGLINDWAIPYIQNP